MSLSPIPFVLENPQNMWLNTLDTIDEVVGDRKYFIKKIKVLVEIMEIRKEIV